MIDGFSISGYRSFGEKEVKVADLSRLNIFIGKNNCGKSNILRCLKLMTGIIRDLGSRQQPAKVDGHLDFSLSSTGKGIRFGLQVKENGFTSATYEAIAARMKQANPSFASRLNKGYWVRYTLDTVGRLNDDFTELTTFVEANFKEKETDRLTDVLCNFTGGSQENRCVRIARVLHQAAITLPSVSVIDAFRKIAVQGEDALSGAGLIEALRRLQNPGFKNYEADKQKFDRIVGFLRSVMSDQSARLEIPAESDDVYVVIDDKTLPLASLGTGIHEVVILAAAVTLTEHSVVCLEEPEIHCHPELQKKFAKYLLEQTSNQYLIASHSSAFVDVAESNTYRCWLDEDGHTECELAATSSERLAMLLDLGYKPSDLLQANFVVWVEGPSDRIYLNAWLKAKAPDLVEGLHYSVMFYGGRLLSHLSYDGADDDAIIQDFVRLARLNPSACIVIDSDRREATDDLNDTKKRIISEFERNECLCWVTAGRAIENYTSEDLLNDAIEKVHPAIKKRLKWERYADLTKVADGKTMDKVAVARYVSKLLPNFSLLDLDASVDHLIKCIRTHNH